MPRRAGGSNPHNWHFLEFNFPEWLLSNFVYFAQTHTAYLIVLHLPHQKVQPHVKFNLSRSVFHLTRCTSKILCFALKESSYKFQELVLENWKENLDAHEQPTVRNENFTATSKKITQYISAQKRAGKVRIVCVHFFLAGDNLEYFSVHNIFMVVRKRRFVSLST